jgi:hypothetical protein
VKWAFTVIFFFTLHVSKTVMKQIVVSVPEEKYDFVMELMKSMDFITVSDSIDIPEEHKSLVSQRKQTANFDKMHDWDELKNQ